MIEILQALAEPRRLEILRTLRGRELPAGEIAARFDVRRPTVSHHLSVLSDAGLVRVRREGTRRVYSIDPEGFGRVQAYLDSFWDERLDRLKDAAERRARGEGRGERN